MSSLPVHVLLVWSNGWHSWAVILLSRNAKVVNGVRRRLTAYCDAQCVVVRAASMEDDDVFEAARKLPPPVGRKSFRQLLLEPDESDGSVPRPH